MADCAHLDLVDDTVTPDNAGCGDCLAVGGRWVHLRMCRTCGHIGCCDDSPARHASAHAASTDHPVISSYEPGEAWWWCYPEEKLFFRPSAADFDHASR